MNSKNSNLKRRGLTDTFMEALLSGRLKKMLDMVIKDHTLDLEIRDNYINIYYRGGNFICIKQGEEYYSASFDENYLDEANTKIKDLPKNLESDTHIQKWSDAVPYLKHEMDLHFTKNKKDEREFQQVIVRENNYGRIANSTDYYICDIEYSGVAGRFDLVAVNWPSTGADRKKKSNRGLSIIEMKYGDGALKGSSGLVGHIEKLNNLILDSERLSKFASEIQTLFNQKRKLGLIPDCKHDLDSISEIIDGNIDYILVLANHDPASSLLWNELKEVKKINSKSNIKVAMSNFSGYGMYEENIIDLDSFMDQYKVQIYSKADKETGQLKL